ncbi:MAG: ribose 5-phosphate isomerase B [Proteobacteria bacterium]|nr:ribose 5-phosphate isomerase B [Pseudomonadota bacterium]
MRLVIGSDHAGYPLKTELLRFLRDQGHELIDVGTHGPESVDYPDYAAKVAARVKDGSAERGLMICGSGVGGAVAANKVEGIRAGLCHDVYSAHQGVEHDDMNVLVLGGLVIGQLLARELVQAFVGAKYSDGERYNRRLEKIRALERRYRRPPTGA